MTTSQLNVHNIARQPFKGTFQSHLAAHLARIKLIIPKSTRNKVRLTFEFATSILSEKKKWHDHHVDLFPGSSALPVPHNNRAGLFVEK